MPTILKKGHKQYHVQIRKRGYPTQTKTFTSLVAAEEWATVIESEMVRGVFVSRNEAEATLVKEVLDRFEAEVLPTKRGEQSYKSRLETLACAFGDYRIASLTSSQVAQFRDRRLKIVGPQSVIHELNLLNRVLKAASTDWGIALPSGLLQHRSRSQLNLVAATDVSPKVSWPPFSTLPSLQSCAR